MSECAETREHHSIASSFQIYYCQSALLCLCLCVPVLGLMFGSAEHRPGQIGLISYKIVSDALDRNECRILKVQFLDERREL